MEELCHYVQVQIDHNVEGVMFLYGCYHRLNIAMVFHTRCEASYSRG